MHPDTGRNAITTRTVVVAACDAPASIWHVVSIQPPEGTRSKVLFTTDSPRVALLIIGNERIIIHFQDNVAKTVNVGETGGNSGVVIDKVDVTYGMLMDQSLGGGFNQDFPP